MKPLTLLVAAIILALSAPCATAQSTYQAQIITPLRPSSQWTLASVFAADLNNKGEVLFAYQFYQPNDGSWPSIKKWQPASSNSPGSSLELMGGQAYGEEAATELGGFLEGVKITDSGICLILGTHLYWDRNGQFQRIPTPPDRQPRLKHIIDGEESGGLLVRAEYSAEARAALSYAESWDSGPFFLRNGAVTELRNTIGIVGGPVGSVYRSFSASLFNKNGNIVGGMTELTLPQGPSHSGPFLLHEGTIHRFPESVQAPGFFVVPRSLNEKGQILLLVSESFSTPLKHYLYLPELDYGWPSAGFIGPIAEHSFTPARLNNRGQIAGFTWGGSIGLDYAPHIWSRGTWLDVRDFTIVNPGITAQRAVRINDNGQILCMGTVSGIGEALLLLTPAFSVKLDFDPEEAGPCDVVECTATVQNNYSYDLQNVFPVVPGLIPTGNTSDPPVAVLGGPIPATPQALAAGTNITFKWKVLARKPGEAQLSLQMRGFNNGVTNLSPEVTSPTIVITNAPLVVNSTGDEPDADPTDACADANLNEPGRQTTLRAAIQTANLLNGKQTILFDLPLVPPQPGGPTISPHTPFPAITDESEILGTSQPGGGWVMINGSGFTGNAALELKGNVTIKGLAFTGFQSQGSAAVHLSAGQNTVKGCRFGLNASGELASDNANSILITASGQQIGGASPGEGNEFGAGKVSILIGKLLGGTAPQGNVIEGNRFGLLDSGFSKNGPGNAIVLQSATGNRVGGTTSGARNRFVSCKGAAIILIGAETSENDIIGNWFGLTPQGTRVFFRDWNLYGIAITDGAHHNRIGGSAPGSRNLISGSDAAGVLITRGGHDNSIEGNWIGLGADGAGAAGNHTGIWIVAGANNRIGGTTPSQRNVISGNRVNGILLGRSLEKVFQSSAEDPGNEFCSNTFVEGNWIGLDQSGTHAVPNGDSDDGVSRRQAIMIDHFVIGTIIGGASAGRRNVISGNFCAGIRVDAAEGTFHSILGNFIGTSVDGLSPFPNKGAGILVIGEPVVAIGDTNVFQQNRIAYNAGPGVSLEKMKGGVDGLELVGNLIFGNDPVGSIALASSRVPNDHGDVDLGPNGKQNWPLPLAAPNLGGVTRVALDLSSFARNIPVRLDVFKAMGGGGEILLGTTTVTTGSDPKDRYVVDAALQSAGTELTALATTADGTSAFSPLVAVVSGQDSDGDGVPDELERRVPISSSPLKDFPTPGDRNGDGVQDEMQANVASAQVLPASARSPWLTVVAAPGRLVTDLVALRSEDLPPLPVQKVINPAGVHFTLSGGDGASEAVQIWLPPDGNPPTVWLLENGGWTQLIGAVVQNVARLRFVAFTLPAVPSGSDWIVAVGQPWTSAPPLRLIASPLQLQTLERPTQEPVPGFSADAPPSPPPPEEWVLRLEIPWPVSIGRWRLETSPDLVQWQDLEARLPPGDTALRLSYPASNPTRFFRWSPR